MLSCILNVFKPKQYKKGYFTYINGSKNLLCKILNEYETEEEAKDELVNLITNEITEKDLYKDFLKKKSW